MKEKLNLLTIAMLKMLVLIILGWIGIIITVFAYIFAISSIFLIDLF
tara:strand:- start:1226 stop:1366 length:141 start_codon:yes stop_codon:yes gene_type:complete